MIKYIKFLVFVLLLGCNIPQAYYRKSYVYKDSVASLLQSEDKKFNVLELKNADIVVYGNNGYTHTITSTYISSDNITYLMCIDYRQILLINNVEYLYVKINRSNDSVFNYTQILKEYDNSDISITIKDKDITIIIKHKNEVDVYYAFIRNNEISFIKE